ncbi:MAG: xanthine dehydrogenase [Rhodobiaceae bacterium]|nr:xanthine dehydrogenase [Rhodobiaceae bacterium]|tara:strand:- start:808 stop:1527 length:720 start_codon:yes stop_codon:yes gene_type:complete
MDKEVLEKILNLKKKKEPFCVVSKANSTDTKVITLSESSKSDLKQSINKALKEDKLILIENNNEEWIINPFNPPPKLIIVGAVHVAQSLALIAENLDFEVIIIDPREAFAEQERFPNNKVICAWPEDAFDELILDSRTAVVTLTHEPNLDDIALKRSLKSKCFYIGALGSKKTHKKRIERFLADNITQDDISKINGPIGLPINAQTPGEIAISIMSEIISSLRNQKYTMKELRENWNNR